MRAYASDRQQPITRQELFLRADRTDAWLPRLELSGFIDWDLHDGSSLLQIGANYDVSDDWSVGALAIGYLGGRRTDFGSLSLAATVLVEATRYL